MADLLEILLTGGLELLSALTERIALVLVFASLAAVLVLWLVPAHVVAVTLATTVIVAGLVLGIIWECRS
jgi:hypothetical protein